MYVNTTKPLLNPPNQLNIQLFDLIEHLRDDRNGSKLRSAVRVTHRARRIPAVAAQVVGFDIIRDALSTEDVITVC